MDNKKKNLILLHRQASPPKQKVKQLESVWDKFLSQTSNNGFSRNKGKQTNNEQRISTSPLYHAKTLNGAQWEGFQNIQRNKIGQGYIPSHFEGGTLMVQVNDEGGLWNRKPLLKYNKAQKQSAIFDAQKYAITPQEREFVQKQISSSHYQQAQTDYSKFYEQDTNRNEYQFKTKQRKPLPKPKEVEQFLEYKRKNDCLQL